MTTSVLVLDLLCDGLELLLISVATISELSVPDST